MATTNKKTTTSSTSKSKTSSYSPTSIKTLTSPSKTTSSSVVMPKIAPGPQTKVPQVTLPKIPAGPQTKVPQVTLPTFPKGPQSVIPGTPGGASYILPGTNPAKEAADRASSSKKTTGSSTTKAASTLLPGTNNYTPISIQALLSESTSAARSSSTSSTSGGTSGRSSNVAGGGTAGSTAVGSGGGDSADDSPAAQLEKARAQLEKLQAQAAGLAAKDTSVGQDAVVSDSEIVKQEKEAAKMLEKLMKPKDDGLDLLNDEIKRNEQLLQQELSSIKQAYDVQKTDVQGKQLSETGETSVGIANAGGYLGFSGSGTGVMLKLAESHRAELTSLESERQNALQEAQAAAANRRFDMVQMKVDEIARIDQEKYERVQEYYSRVKENAEVEKVKAERKQTENSIYTAIQAGAKSAEDIFAVLGGAVSADEINKFLKAVVPDSVREVGAGFKFSATNSAALLGAGMGQDDIQAMNEYINENGYDEVIRGNLTPLQRAAADKIFRPVAGSSTSGFGKPMGVLDLDRIEESYGVRFPFGTTQAEATQFFADNPGATPEEMQAALDQTLGGGAKSGSMINFDTDYLKNNLDLDQQKKLADLVGASSWWTGKETDVNRMFENPAFITNLNDRINDLRAEGIADEDIIDALTS